MVVAWRAFTASSLWLAFPSHLSEEFVFSVNASARAFNIHFLCRKKHLFSYSPATLAFTPSALTFFYLPALGIFLDHTPFSFFNSFQSIQKWLKKEALPPFLKRLVPGPKKKRYGDGKKITQPLEMILHY